MREARGSGRLEGTGRGVGGKGAQQPRRMREALPLQSLQEATGSPSLVKS